MVAHYDYFVRSTRVCVPHLLVPGIKTAVQTNMMNATVADNT